MAKIKARIERKWADLWIGAYFRRSRPSYIPDDQGDKWESIEYERLDIWVCLIPCFPIHFLITWSEERFSETETLDRIVAANVEELE